MFATEPLSVTFHLTHACNLRCSYCFTGEKLRRSMARATGERAVDFALEEARRTDRSRLNVVFFGGEPLIELHLLCSLVDRMDAAKGDLCVSYSLSTNGVLLDRRAMEELAQRRVFVSLSVDGAPEVQDEQRPNAAGGGSADAVSRAIDLLLAENPFANATCVVTPASARRLDESVRWLVGRGFRYVTTTLDYGADWRARELWALERAYRRLSRWYDARTRAGEKLYLSVFDERIRTWTAGPAEAGERCGIGTRQFSIAPSGRLYPCVQFVHEDADDTYGIGDVWSGFDEARRASLSSTSRREHAECAGCELLERCSSWCACANFRSTGRLDAVSPVLCEHERRVMPIADRLANRMWRRRDPLFVHKFYNPAFPVLAYAEEAVQRAMQRTVER